MKLFCRSATVRNADRLFVETPKGIEEQGTHDELVEKGGTLSIFIKLK